MFSLKNLCKSFSKPKEKPSKKLPSRNFSKIKNPNPLTQYCDWAYIAPRLTSLILINGQNPFLNDSSPFPLESVNNFVHLCACVNATKKMKNPLVSAKKSDSIWHVCARSTPWPGEQPEPSSPF